MFLPSQLPPPCPPSPPLWPAGDVWSAGGLWSGRPLCPPPVDRAQTAQYISGFPKIVIDKSNRHCVSDGLNIWKQGKTFNFFKSHLVQGVPQGDLAGDQSVGQVVVFLLQTEAGLLKPTVFLLKNTQIYQRPAWRTAFRKATEREVGSGENGGLSVSAGMG